MSIRSFREDIKEDKHYIRYVAIRATAAKALPYEKLCAEIDLIMVARQVRAYAVSKLQPRELLSVSMDEISHRARSSEILLVAKRSRSSLADVLDGVWNHVNVEYGEHLKEFKTKSERDGAVTSCFRMGYEFLGNLDSLIEQTEIIIKDIDQCSFGLTRAANLMELLLRRENLVNIEI